MIATPNSTHLPIAKAALEAGIPVVSDKPATATYDEVLELEKVVKAAGLPYALTHTYAGYALVRDARALCASGELGEIRKVTVEYLQGWLSQPIEKSGQKQAAWRIDPKLNGPGGCDRGYRDACISLDRVHQRIAGDGDECAPAVGGGRAQGR